MRDPSPYAGKTVRLRADAAELGGQEAEIVDWYDNTVDATGWQSNPADPRVQSYTPRRGLGGLPADDDVLLARVDGIVRIIHRTEIEGEATPATPAGGAPKVVDEREVGLPCPACEVPLAAGDLVAVHVLGPGADPQARADAAAGLPYPAKVIELHWACATGQEV